MRNPKIQITLTPEMVKFLKEKSKESGVSIAAFIRLAMNEKYGEEVKNEKWNIK